jgi:hypothetical protein
VIPPERGAGRGNFHPAETSKIIVFFAQRAPFSAYTVVTLFFLPGITFIHDWQGKLEPAYPLPQ